MKYRVSAVLFLLIVLFVLPGFKNQKEADKSIKCPVNGGLRNSGQESMILFNDTELAIKSNTSPSEYKEYEDMHLGLFVHYMFPGKEYRWGATTWADGTKVKSLDELADNLDVEDLAKTAASMRAQFLIFTTWHANMNSLFPGKTIQAWIPGHSSKRDVIRELIDALNSKGIKLVLYVHPSDGNDFAKEDQDRTGWNDGPPYERWNNFINDVFAEVTDRYGKDIAGFYIDGGLPPQVDAKRLRKTIAYHKPEAWLIQNSGLNPDLVNYGARERMSEPWPASDWLMCQTVTNEWWAMSSSVNICPELAYKYTVLQASVASGTGGGVTWSFGPHPGGRWESGVRSFCKRLGELVDNAGPSIFGTRPSRSFITKTGTPLTGLPYVATESKDGRVTYLHLLLPPVGTTIKLPPPEDGKKFSGAELLNGEQLRLTQNDEGIIISVKSTDFWDDTDTIIRLKL
jgi:alpha-L-fucosidase